MRISGKLFSLFLVITTIVSIMSSVVSADEVVLVEKGICGTFRYELYSDGELVCYPSSQNLVAMNQLKSETLAKVKSLTVDISKGDPDYDGYCDSDVIQINIYGYNYDLSSVRITGSSSRCEYYGVVIKEFPDLGIDDIVFDDEMTLVGAGFISMPCIGDIGYIECLKDTRELMFMDCDNMVSADFSFYEAQVITVSGCDSVKGIIMSDCCEHTYIYDCGNLKRISVPDTLEWVDYLSSISCFYDCESLTDVYYSGSKEQFDQIKVFKANSVDTGKTVSNLLCENATVHYFDGQPAMWIRQNDESWMYFDKHGNYSTGWEKVGSAWYYFNSDGIMQSGWQKVDGFWYYLEKSGAMKTGWLKDNGVWYYLSDNGSMVTGWKQIEGKWYFFDDSGAMKTGWLLSGGTWYYLNSSGDMATGWVLSGGKWYYMNTNGAMAAGWIKLGNTWYYLEPSSGAMVTGTCVIDGVTYVFDDTGAWIG